MEWNWKFCLNKKLWTKHDFDSTEFSCFYHLSSHHHCNMQCWNVQVATRRYIHSSHLISWWCPSAIAQKTVFWGEVDWEKAEATSDRHSKNDKNASYENFMNILDIPSLLSLSISHQHFILCSTASSWEWKEKLFGTFIHHMNGILKNDGCRNILATLKVNELRSMECSRQQFAASFENYILYFNSSPLHKSSKFMIPSCCCPCSWSKSHQKIFSSAFIIIRCSLVAANE